jgi:subtilisin family serine protease
VEHLRLVNLSFYGLDPDENPEPPLIRKALEDLFQVWPDVLVVAAAGNRGKDSRVYPAAFNQDFEQVIAVGALDTSVSVEAQPLKASFSNCWNGIDVYAPGVLVLGPTVWHQEPSPGQTFTGWCLWSGTSFAAATVTGMLAATMIKEGLSGVQAKRRIIQPLFEPTPGVSPEHRKPQLQGVTVNWPVPPDQRLGSEENYA